MGERQVQHSVGVCNPISYLLSFFTCMQELFQDACKKAGGMLLMQGVCHIL